MTYETEDPKLQAIIADLVDEYTLRISRAEPVDIDAISQRHPEFADEIRETLATLKSLIEFDVPFHDDQPHPSIHAELKQLGDYQLLREVGRGGMGVIYEATQISMDRRVALKVLPFAGLADPNRLNRFRNEVRAAGALHHPHIVPVYAVGSQRGLHFFAMQFIDGPSADVLIRTLRETASEVDVRTSPEPFPARDAKTVTDIQALISTQREQSPATYHRTVARWGADAAEALAHAHENGVLHRDIKPGNLLIDGQGKVWVADFGLARLESDVSMTMTGDLVGTLRYMAPEQALARRVLIDHRADVYALGATLYEMLSLQPIWDGKNRDELLRQIAMETPRPLCQQNPAIDRDLETILHKAIEKDPSDRYNSAQDFADDLQRYLDGSPISARPLSTAMKGARWAAKHPGKSATMVAVMLAISLVAFWLVDYRGKVSVAVESRLSRANAYDESSQFEAAQREVALARAAIGSLLGASSALSAQIADTAQRISARQQAYATYAQFHSLYDEITANLHFATRGELGELFDKCQRALSKYRSASDYDLERHVDFQSLKPEEQGRTKERFLELLFVTAVTGMGERHADADERHQQYRQAIELFSAISALSQPSAGTESWSAFAHRGLERISEAQTLEEEAASLPSQTYLDWLMLGEYQYAQVQMKDAAHSFEMALQVEPRGYLALMSLATTLGHLYWFDEGYAEAHRKEGVCTGAIAVNPNSPHPYLLRSLARWDIDGKQDLADNDLSIAARIAPRNPHVMVVQATFAGRKGDLDECLSLLKEAQRVSPTVLPGHTYYHAHWLISSYTPVSGTDSLEEAAELLTATLSKLPENPPPALGTFFNPTGTHDPWEMRVSALIRRGMLRRKLESAHAARRDLETAVEFPIRSETQNALRGLALLLLDRHEEFIEAFGNIRFDQVDQHSMGIELLCLVPLLDTDSATFLKQVVAQFPDAWRNPNTCPQICRVMSKCFYRSGRLQESAGDFEAALPLYAKSVEFDPLQAAHYFKLGQCHFRLGDNANAIGWLTKAIELDPKNIESYGQRGLAHGASGNLESAIADFDRVLALHAHDIWCVRAVYQVKLGRVDDYEGSIAKERSKESPSIPGGSRPGPSDAPTWWFTLAPIDWDGMNKVVEVARQRLRDSEKARGLEAPETRLLRKELGTALYRVGNFDEAARELTAALTPPEGEGAMDVQQRSLAASFLSMAEAKRENAEAAEQWLGLASQWATQWAEAAKRSHHQRVRIELAISEATKTLAAN